MYTICAITSHDVTAMQFHQFIGKIQSDAIASLIRCRKRGYPIEAIEHILKLLFVNTWTIVCNSQVAIFCIRSQMDGNLSTATNILHGICQQVIDHLIKIITIKPNLYTVIFRHTRKFETAYFGLITIIAAHIANIVRHIRFGIMQFHLSFLYTANT